MALSTYAELKVSLADLLDRHDLTTQLDDFITLAESDIKRRIRTEHNFLPVASDTTLLQAAPDLYLYGALVHSAPFLQHDERMPLWQSLYEKALIGYNAFIRARAPLGAIVDHASLVATLENTLGDLNLTGHSERFVNQAEARIKRLLKRRTVQENVLFLAGIPSFDLTTLTTAIDSLRVARLSTATASRNRPLESCSAYVIQQRQGQFQSSGPPYYCGVIGSELLLAPIPDQDYAATLTYFARILPCQQDATQLNESPDLYLYGALVEATPYITDRSLTGEWLQKFETAVMELKTQQQREEHGAAPAPLYIPNPIG